MRKFLAEHFFEPESDNICYKRDLALFALTQLPSERRTSLTASIPGG
jgi:hypothetical protein